MILLHWGKGSSEAPTFIPYWGFLLVSFAKVSRMGQLYSRMVMVKGLMCASHSS